MIAVQIDTNSEASIGGGGYEPPRLYRSRVMEMDAVVTQGANVEMASHDRYYAKCLRHFFAHLTAPQALVSMPR